MQSWCFVAIFTLFGIATVSAMRKQGVAIKGQLMCGTQPAQNVKVRIVDIDTGRLKNLVLG